MDLESDVGVFGDQEDYIKGTVTTPKGPKDVYTTNPAALLTRAEFFAAAATIDPPTVSAIAGMVGDGNTQEAMKSLQTQAERDGYLRIQGQRAPFRAICRVPFAKANSPAPQNTPDVPSWAEICYEIEHTTSAGAALVYMRNLQDIAINAAQGVVIDAVRQAAIDAAKSTPEAYRARLAELILFTYPRHKFSGPDPEGKMKETLRDYYAIRKIFRRGPAVARGSPVANPPPPPMQPQAGPSQATKSGRSPRSMETGRYVRR
jgi:hypothetical protein